MSENEIRRYLSQNPHEIRNELVGDGISDWGRYYLFKLGIDVEDDADYKLCSVVCLEMKGRVGL